MRQLILRNFSDKKDGIMSGKITAFLHYLKPQPPEGYEYRGKFNDKEIFSDGDGAYFVPKGVFRPGEVVYIREGYRFYLDEKGKMVFIYLADDEEKDPSLNWKPGSYMPIEAARIFLELTRTEIMRLNDLSEEAARATGAEGNNPQQQAIEQWDSDLNRNQGRMRAKFNPWIQVVYFHTIPRPEGLPEGLERVLDIFTRYNYIIRDAKTGEIVAEGDSKTCASIMGYSDDASFRALVKRIRDGKCTKYTFVRVKLRDSEENESASGNDLAERNDDA